jgi:hypothetical protein
MTVLALWVFTLCGCVAPLLMAPAMISSAFPAMVAMTASAAARSAAARQQQAGQTEKPNRSLFRSEKTPAENTAAEE